MKKYLMTGMAAIALCAAFTSCSKTDMYDQGAVDEKKAQEQQKVVESIENHYENAFIATFGQPAANHCWGFNHSSAKTRGTRGEARCDVEGKFWARKGYGDYGYIVPGPMTEAQKDKVRRYFQQNRNPGGTNAEAMSEYFIQHVYKGGTKVTEDSHTTEQYVTSSLQSMYGSSHMDLYVCGSSKTHSKNFNGTDATAIDVWDGFTYENGYTLTGTEDVDFNYTFKYKDKIMFMRDVDTNCFGWFESNGSREVTDHYRLVSGDVIQQWDSSTTVNGESSDVSGMMFVGFDYESNSQKAIRTWENNNGYWYWGGNANMSTYREATDEDPEESKAYFENHYGPEDKMYVNACADGYYSDWIVRIVKAEKLPDWQGRIMAEDLNADEESDFDFNDVVFDWKIEGRVATILIRAAGGIYPLYVGDEEVHSKLGHQAGADGQYPMINTGTGVTGTAQSYTYTFPEGTSAEAINIPVYVVKDGTPASLSAETGKAASKINVPATTRWVKEFEDIINAYPGFKGWVADPNALWTNNYNVSYLY